MALISLKFSFFFVLIVSGACLGYQLRLIYVALVNIESEWFEIF